MNFIKQIEASLKAINQARFQDLINHLLHLKGNKFVGAPGSVVAKEKTSKGAPDSFFLKEDKYIFVECTTQEKLGHSKNFIEKLLKDIDHCFDVAKTGIAKNNIEQIILACTDKITTDEFKQLKEKVSAYNADTKLKILDIQNLPLNIYDFPGLSEQYLGIQIVKGEIYNLPDFIIKTTKGLQPSLINQFLGREEELKESLIHLQDVDILVLSGPAGVGKSKMATAILEEASRDNFIPIVVQSSAVPLWDDFVHLFQNGKDYIILFDDANKSVQNLAYLLDFVQKPRTNKLKVVITVREYVKQNVYKSIINSNSKWKEVEIGNLKDEEISKIILGVLPNLKYHFDIKTKIIELAKGNARVALMATYSITPGAEINYLSSPVKLYEKYFEKISTETEIFSKPIMLQALAIVSFFGVLDRKNSDINKILKEKFNIDWDELWVAILELNSHEILDVYANEIVKVSDQVLASYAFYKCFIDKTSAAIDYGQWIMSFLASHSSRINRTLIDINNTFNYHHIKELVLPHLQKVILKIENGEQEYAFYKLFWFYKDYDALKFLQNWINNLPAEGRIDSFEFSYAHNDHIRATSYFELLINFWDHPSELLKPSIELAIQMVSTQPSRLPEFLKFLSDHFKYKINDLDNDYKRQHTLLEVLLGENRSELHKKISFGIFLNIINELLGWDFTQFGPSKGGTFSFFNFELQNTPSLLALRNKILDGFYQLFEVDKIQSNKILEKIVFPGGDIDKEVYINEIPIYQKLIHNKFSIKQYAHCNFVKKLTKRIQQAGGIIPKEWSRFTDSKIMQLSSLLKIGDDRKGKSFKMIEAEKEEVIKAFISEKNFDQIKDFLFSVSDFYIQQEDHSIWKFQHGITAIFKSIGDKSKVEIEKALGLFFNGSLSFSLNTSILNYLLNKNILTGIELYTIIYKEDFSAKLYWLVCFFNALPKDQTDIYYMPTLIQVFKTSEQRLPINNMTDFSKFQNAFEEYQRINDNNHELANHNIITYLTEILYSRKSIPNISFGFEFCQSSHSYFSNHFYLLKNVFLFLKTKEDHFDYDGKELEIILDIDENFLIDCIEQNLIGFNYSSALRFDRFVLDSLWKLNNYETIIEKILLIMPSKTKYLQYLDDDAAALFTFKNIDDETSLKVQSFIDSFIEKHYNNQNAIILIMIVVYRKFQNQFTQYLKKFLLLNKDFEIVRNIEFDRSESWSGSRVPVIQTRINFINEIIEMIKTLPTVLDYTNHLQYFEQKITWAKKDIEHEQKRDFMEYYD